MGLISEVSGPVGEWVATSSLAVLLATGFGSLLFLAVALNVLYQVLVKNPHEPPLVFHWFPIIGSTISYGVDPYKFFFACREKYGDIFTFILLGRKTTVYLGTKGNDFILNGKHRDLNAEEIYGPLCTPVFGKDVVYDCPNSKLMEQKKFVKFGLTSDALRSYVTLISKETRDYFTTSPVFAGKQSGTMDVVKAMSELTIYTASRSLQGKEVREKFDSHFADLFHDLDMGFSPINFMLPWAPLPHNRKRDAAHKVMVDTYTEIIRNRKASKPGDKESGNEKELDMVWNLMACRYKDGRAVPDYEVAHMMIALLMAGQHSSSSTSSWITLRLATKPYLVEELLEEQKKIMGKDLPPLTYDALQKLPLHNQVVKETLRLHAPIHSILRKVTSPMPIEGTPYVIPTTHTLLAAPGVSARLDEYFPNAMEWDPHRWDEGSGGVIATATEDEEKIDYGYGLVTKGASSPYLPFGAGRHRCIGEQFAYVQLVTILASMVRMFRFENLPGKEGVVDTDYSSLFSRPMTPATIRWEKRREGDKA